MSIFLSIQNTYATVDVALFNAEICIDTVSINKSDASKKITTLLEQLLKKNCLNLSDITFIAANQGPGPFTSLRVVLTTVNALQFARQIPLVGIDGLHALQKEYNDSAYSNTIVLLDAFNKDVYYCFKDLQTAEIKTGYKKYNILLDELSRTMPNIKIRFIGNGAYLHQDTIKDVFGDNAFIPEQKINHCSIEQIGIMGWQQWQKKQNVCDQLLPLYLKKHAVQL